MQTTTVLTVWVHAIDYFGKANQARRGAGKRIRAFRFQLEFNPFHGGNLDRSVYDSPQGRVAVKSLRAEHVGRRSTTQ